MMVMRWIMGQWNYMSEVSKRANAKVAKVSKGRKGMKGK
jgi:hypothetical protein